LLLLLAGEEGEVAAPEELHAARAAAAAAAAGTASSTRSRVGLLPVRRALPPLLRPGIFRVVMTFCPLSRVIGTEDKHVCFPGAQEHGRGLSSVKRLARPHMDV
jgi:hypothetical protein